MTDKGIHSKITITRFEDNTYTAKFEGVTCRHDVILLLKMANRFYRRRLSMGISEAENFPLVLSNVKEVENAT